MPLTPLCRTFKLLENGLLCGRDSKLKVLLSEKRAAAAGKGHKASRIEAAFNERKMWTNGRGP